MAYFSLMIASGVDPAVTAAVLNRDLARISSWADMWKVTFNASKSKDMIFSNNKVLNNSPPLTLNGCYMARISSHKHLCLYLTSNLDWSLHVHETCLRANRKLSVIRSVQNLSRTTLDLLYKLTVRSVVDYALLVYGSSL